MSSWQAGVALLVLVVGGILFKAGAALVKRSLGSRRLKKVVAELDAAEPGWQWEDVQARRIVVAPEENGAQVVAAARRLLARPPVKQELEERLSAWPREVQLSSELYEALRAETERQASALTEARRLHDYPHGRFSLAYTYDWHSTDIADLEATRYLAALLRFDAALSAHDCKPDESLKACLSAFNAGRSVGDEPMLFGQLIRVACGRKAIQGIERTLAQGEPSETLLAEAQQLLADEWCSLPELLLIAAQGDRAFSHRSFVAFERGELTLAPFVRDQPEAEARVIAAEMLSNGTRWRLHADMLGHLTDFVRLAARPTHEWPEAAVKLERRAAQSRLTVRRFLSTLATVPTAFLSYHGLLACALAGVATERYRQRYGSWPAALAELQPEILAKLPCDPYDAMPLRYQRVADGVVVHSMALKGNEDRQPAETEPGLRLWEPAQRHRAKS